MTLLFTYFIKASIISAIALTIAHLLSGKSAAVRHWILSVAVVCSFCVPFATLLLPAWNIGPVIVSTDTVSVSIGAISPAAQSAAAGLSRAPLDLLRQMVPWLWLTGSLAGMLSMFIGFIRVTRLSRSSRRNVGEVWRAAANDISYRYGLRRRVQLLLSHNSTILVTWGVLLPKILLPAGSENWPEERIRAVLCHELSHIRRGDWWIQSMAEILRSVFWFNPLMWILCRRLRTESEYACDDAALGQGFSGAEYAAQLLDIVGLLQITNRPWSSALGMASPSTIERRFAAMLNPRANRQSVSRRAMTVIAIAALGVSLPLAVLSAAPRVQVQIRQSNVQPSPVLVSAMQPATPAVSKAATPVAAVPVQSTPVQTSTSAPPTAAPPQQFRGEDVTLHVRGLSLGNFFEVIAGVSGLNVVVDPALNDVRIPVLNLDKVPWDQVLDTVLRENQLMGTLEGTTLRIRQRPTSRADSIQLTFEIYRNGSLLGSPRITTTSGNPATLRQGKPASDGSTPGPDDLKISATPTQSNDGRISLDLEIFVGASGTRNVLVVSSGDQRSITWRGSTGEQLEAQVTTLKNN
jgi:beta-lactamase regulating signal transducer with metallopeptidase domain